MQRVHGEGHLQHERERSSRLDVTIDKLSQYVETDLVVGDCLDNADRNRKDKGNRNSQQESPPGQVGGPPQNGDETKRKHLVISITHTVSTNTKPKIEKAGYWRTYEDKQRHIPPARRLLVFLHQLHVDIRLLMCAVFPLLPDRLAMVKIRVNK